MYTRIALLAAAVLVLAACGDDAGTTTVAEAPSTTAAATTTTAAATTTTTAAATTAATPPTSPADVVFEAQASDGSSIVVASVTLPAPGFIAVHGNAAGSPGPVVGHSALLPAGTSTNVEVTLDEPLTETDLLFPMAHIDANGNGEYEFFPPDETTDGPAFTADGDVAVVGAEVTVGGNGEAAAVITISGFSFGNPVTIAVGQRVLVTNDDPFSHTWTSADGVFDSGSLGQGDEYTTTFDEPGEYPFFCRIHPEMSGIITVAGDGA